jgi:phenylpropionate dioxygenase-like ring-hydroxylating dioxygenase large terminal subunit
MSQELFTLPQKYFASSEIYSKELDKIFHKEWICVGRLEQIPEPVDFIVQNVGHESIIILKDHDDIVPYLAKTASGLDSASNY